MRIVVLGAAGQLGRDLCPRLSGDVVPLTRAEADLTQPECLRTAIMERSPEVVVNCAAYNFVDRAESEPEAAFASNVWGVRTLATCCRDLDCTLVQFSSDYVFGLDATRSTPYLEGDAPGPVSIYGLSKLTGEYLARSLCPRHLVIRTCGLYGVWGSGGKGGNFVETMLRLAASGKPLRVVADQVLTPSYTADVADATASLIQAGRYGLYHITNAGACSWHEFAQTIMETAMQKVTVTPISSEEFGAAARRPGYSVMSSGAAGAPRLRSWQEALGAYFNERRRRTEQSRGGA